MSKRNQTKRPVFTEDDLRELARHIRHELDMFRFTYSLVPGYSPMGAVILECFLLHWRNLWYFLLEAPREQDVVASDYIEGWKQQRPLPDVRERVHTMLAHITKPRMTAKGFEFSEVQEMFEQVSRLWTEFCRNLSSDEKRGWFGEHDLTNKFPFEYHGLRFPAL